VVGVSLVNSALAVVNIAYVPVGNAGNASDSTGYGAVPYHEEWNDAVVSGSSRGLRGGAWASNFYYIADLASSDRSSNVPAFEFQNVGFRVATVPEPSCLVLTLLASGLLVVRRKR
jgi:formylglycine-generating enzyme required for sulfatase activity